MSISSEVDAELAALGHANSWRAEVVRSLALELDEKPNASIARELRAVMIELGSGVSASSKGDVGDDLAAKRRARIAEATG
jgi:hypothetical protein